MVCTRRQQRTEERAGPFDRVATEWKEEVVQSGGGADVHLVEHELHWGL